MKIARLIVTWACRRDCDNCCNKMPGLRESAKPCSVADLKDYDQVLITGGEPMLYPAQVLKLIRQLRSQRTAAEQKVFLYTALYTPELRQLVPELDGVHFTLHYPLKRGDVQGFYMFQDHIGYLDKGKSFRLYIEPRITKSITIVPNVWSRLEVKPWLTECSLPDGETLLKLRENLF